MSQVPPYLAKWVQDKLDSYKEESRAGIPRGQPHGVPKHKYHAGLLHLAHNKTFDLRAIARHAGVSYGLLLKWRTEDRFRELIRRAIHEYSRVVVLRVVYEDHERVHPTLYHSFIVREVLNYSASLTGRIAEDLDRLGQSYKDKMCSSQGMKQIDQRRLVKTFLFLYTLKWEGGKTSDRVPGLQRGEFLKLLLSKYLNMIRKSFKLTLGKGSKKDVEEQFDFLLQVTSAAYLAVMDLGRDVIRKPSAGKTADPT